MYRRALPRLFTWAAVVGTSAGLLGAVQPPMVAAASSIPTTGPATPASMQVWVTAAEQVMQQYHLPGASLAVAFEGRVVLEKGLGYADTQAHALVQPTSGFRLASVSKAITSTLVGQLVNEHKLSLTTKPFATVLSKLRGPHNSAPVDPRLKDITVQELLNHQGGWDITALGYDPVFNPGPEQKALGLKSSPSCEAAIDFMLSVKLNFTPGKQTHYSNFGFCVLADTIAHVTGLPYSQTAEEMLFKPLGMNHTALASNDLNARQPGEVHYYGQAGETSGSQSPYQLSLSAVTGAGSWVSTAPDLERFLIATTGAVPGSKSFPTWPQGLIGISPAPAEQSPVPVGQGTYWNFDGSLPGTSTEIGVFGPITYVMLTNSRNPDSGTQFTPVQKVAEKWMSLPASAWPAGNLLSPPAK